MNREWASSIGKCLYLALLKKQNNNNKKTLFRSYVQYQSTHFEKNVGIREGSGNSCKNDIITNEKEGLDVTWLQCVIHEGKQGVGTNELFNLVVKGITKINALTQKPDKLFIIAGLWVTAECPFMKQHELSGLVGIRGCTQMAVTGLRYSLSSPENLSVAGKAPLLPFGL